MIHNKFIGILFIVAFLITFFLIGGARADDQKLVVPSPMEIRDYEHSLTN